MKISYFNSLILLLIMPLFSWSQWLQHPSPINHSIQAKGYFETSEADFVVTNCGTFSKPKGTDIWNLYNALVLLSYGISDNTLMATSQYEWDGISYGIFTLDINESDPDPKKLGYDWNTCVIFKSTEYWLQGSENSGFAYLDNEEGWSYRNDGLPVDAVYDWESGEYYYYLRVFSLAEKQGIIYAGTQRGLYKTTPDNFIWEQLAGFPENKINVLKVFNDTLFAATENQAYYSTDDTNWTSYFQAETKINDLLMTDDEFYIALEEQGIMYSGDQEHWFELNNGLNDLNVNFIVDSNQGLVCGTQSTGLNYFYNGFWSENNEGILYSALRSFAVSLSGIYCNSSHQVWCAPNGYNLQEITPSLDEKYFGSVSTIGDTVILTYKTVVSNPNIERDNFLVFSIDRGASWVAPENQPPYWGDDTYRIVIGESGFYAYEDDQMFYTEDMGKTWLAMPVPPQYCNMFYGALEYNHIPYAAACSDNDMLKWENNNWQLIDNGLPEKTIGKLFACDGGIFAFIRNDEVYVSKDEGISWKKTSDDLPDLNFIRSSTYYENAAFITSPLGVFYTDDYGNKWVSLNQSLPAEKTFSTAIYKDTLFVSTPRNGLWKNALSDIQLSTNEIVNANGHFKLFPNPTDDLFYIENENVSTNYNVQIIDLNGRLVIQKTVRNNEAVDVYLLTPGMYMVTVTTNGTPPKTRKLIISR